MHVTPHRVQVAVPAWSSHAAGIGDTIFFGINYDKNYGV